MLVSFRLWAHAHASHNTQAVPDWRLGFRAARLPPGTEGLFDQLLHAIFSGSRELLQIQHLGCVGIGPDEMTFLQAVALHQNQQQTQAAFLLHQWLAPAAGRITSAMIMDLSRRLDSAGYYLPLRQEAQSAVLVDWSQSYFRQSPSTVH